MGLAERSGGGWNLQPVFSQPHGVLLEEGSPSVLPALPGLSPDALRPLLTLHPN